MRSPNPVLSMSCAFLASLTFLGCWQQNPRPSFTPAATGSAATDFGQLSDGLGNLFSIQLGTGGGPSKILNDGSDGQSSFGFDDEGRLTDMTSTDGSKIILEHADQGGDVGVQVQGTKILGQVLSNLQFTIPGGESSRTAARMPARAGLPAQQTDSTCDLISAACEIASGLIGDIRPVIADSIVNLAVEEVPAPRSLIVLAVNSVMDQYLSQVENFCTAWNTLLAEGTDPCAAVNP